MSQPSLIQHALSLWQGFTRVLDAAQPAALQQHVTWGVILVFLALFGCGKWALDHWLAPRWRRVSAP